MTLRRCVVLAVCASLLSACAALRPSPSAKPEGPNSWVAPQLQSAPGEIPKLQQPLAVDGDLKEWAGSASVPIRCRAYLSKTYPVYGWSGPADAGMEVFCAWTAEGLALAANVTDDDLQRLDALEIYVAGNPDKNSADSAAPAGVRKITIHPPLGDKAAQLDMGQPPAPSLATGKPLSKGKAPAQNKAPAAANEKAPPRAPEAAAKFAGKKTGGGWTAELLLPWSLLPGFKPAEGAEIAMQFALSESDSRMWQSYVLTQFTYGGVKGWGKKGAEVKAENLPQWMLVYSLRPMEMASLEPMVAVDVPRVIGVEPPRPIAVEVGSTLSDLVKSLHVNVFDPPGHMIVGQQMERRECPAACAGSLCAQADWPARMKSDGFYLVQVVAQDYEGKPLFDVARPVLRVANTIAADYDRIAKADIAKVAQREPSEAVEWLGVGATIERMKQGAEKADVEETILRAKEIDARIAVLEGAKPDVGKYPILNLLTLAQGPQDGVSLEFNNPNQCTLVFYWGSLPLAWASAAQQANAEAARQAVEGEGKGGGSSETIDLAGLPARLAAMDSVKDNAAQLTVAAGDRVISVYASSRKSAELVARLIAAGKPVADSDLDALRRQTVEDLAPKADPAAGDGKELHMGDVHMHSIYSDGSASPVGLMLQGMYCHYDYAVMSDHNNVEGAPVAQRLFQEHGVAFPIVKGQEISEFIHMNAYPLQERIPWNLMPEEAAKRAHEQGAAIQWNHPGGGSEWAKKHLAEGIAGTGLDAWEHYPAKYEEWKKAGALSTIVGSTDEHFGFVGPNQERTLFFAPAPTGEALADAVRSKSAVALFGKKGRLFYGPDDAEIAKVWATLAEGKSMKEAKAERLRAALKDADIAGLLRDSPVKPAPFHLLNLAPLNPPGATEMED
ncbi:MAG: hypothetical protein NTW86_27610 [Candidatus Sumerlaeota bacterium]|nr:hypothetical protein [Candidatus Sumerlaeota bacterium]